MVPPLYTFIAKPVAKQLLRAPQEINVAVPVSAAFKNMIVYARHFLFCRDEAGTSRDLDPNSSERRIFVSNIAYEICGQEIEDLFRTEGLFFIGLSHILV
jgi:hypothetical protein